MDITLHNAPSKETILCILAEIYTSLSHYSSEQACFLCHQTWARWFPKNRHHRSEHSDLLPLKSPLFAEMRKTKNKFLFMHQN